MNETRKEVLISTLFAVEHVLKDEGRFDVEQIMAVQAMIALEPAVPPWAPAEGGKVLNCQKNVNATPGTWPHYAVTITKAVTESWRLDGSPRGKFYRFVLCTLRDAVRDEIERVRQNEAKARREEERREREKRHAEIVAQNAELAAKLAEDAKKREAEEAERRAAKKAKREQDEKQRAALTGLIEASKRVADVAPVPVAPAPKPAAKTVERRGPPKFTTQKVVELVRRAPSENKDPEKVVEWIVKTILVDERYSASERAALYEALKQDSVPRFAVQASSIADAEREAAGWIECIVDDAKRKLCLREERKRPEPEKGAPVYSRPKPQHQPKKAHTPTEKFNNFQDVAKAFERRAAEAAQQASSVAVDPAKELERIASEMGADLTKSEDREAVETLLKEQMEANRPKGPTACACTDDRPSVEECLGVVRQLLEESDAPAATAKNFIQAVRLAGRPNQEVSSIELGVNKALAHLMRVKASQNFSTDFNAGAMSKAAEEEKKAKKKNKSKEKGRKGSDARAA